MKRAKNNCKAKVDHKAEVGATRHRKIGMIRVQRRNRKRAAEAVP